MLISLQLLRLPWHSRALVACLETIYRVHAARLGPRTFAFWQQTQA